MDQTENAKRSVGKRLEDLELWQEKTTIALAMVSKLNNNPQM